MTAKVKVFGTRLTVRDAAPAPNRSRQVRVVVATTSRQKAAAVMGISVGELRSYGSETGNRDEIAQAMTSPGTAFYFDERGDKRWHPLRQVPVLMPPGSVPGDAGTTNSKTGILP